MPGTGMSANSAYELQRDATVAENQAKLRALGLERVAPTPPPRQQARRHSLPASEPTRSSKRTLRVAPDYTGEKIDAFDGDERRLRLAATAAPAGSVAAPAAAPAAAPKQKGPRVPSAIVDAVRSYVEEHMPEEDALEERQMFGMAMWLVRGNMFLGVGLNSERLLVRVGGAPSPSPSPSPSTFTLPHTLTLTLTLALALAIVIAPPGG